MTRDTPEPGVRDPGPGNLVTDLLAAEVPELDPDLRRKVAEVFFTTPGLVALGLHPTEAEMLLQRLRADAAGRALRYQKALEQEREADFHRARAEIIRQYEEQYGISDAPTFKPLLKSSSRDHHWSYR